MNDHVLGTMEDTKQIYPKCFQNKGFASFIQGIEYELFSLIIITLLISMFYIIDFIFPFLSTSNKTF